jgi:hypothetical protein
MMFWWRHFSSPLARVDSAFFPSPVMSPLSSSRLLSRASVALAAVSALLGFTGCGTVPVTHKTRSDAAARLAEIHAVRAAPLDIEVEQITAGGLHEKNDDLTTLVGKNISTALWATHAFKADGTGMDLPDVARAELDEVQALLRAITANDAMPFGPFVPAERARNPQPLTYQVGRIDRLANALGTDAVLFLFVRDQYSTGGRKAVMALAMVAGAAAGVAVTPGMGMTVSSAALVDRDGTVLWFNELGAAGLDLRLISAASEWTKRLMTGLPALPADAATAAPLPGGDQPKN